MDLILIVEDEPQLKDSLARLLAQEKGLSALSAGTLKDALAVIDGHQPSLIVADLGLPDGTGLDLLRELGVRQKKVPVLFMTAFLKRFSVDYPELAQLNILQKPIDSKELVTRIRAILSDDQARLKAQAAFTVADYLQLAGLARRSVRLRIQAAGTDGAVVVKGGTPVWAQDQFEAGHGAFRRLALLETAEITCAPCDDMSVTPNLSGSLEHLLLEAARAADESAQSRSLPPAVLPNVSQALARPTGAPTPVAKVVPRPPLRTVRPAATDRTASEGDHIEMKATKTAQTLLSNLDAILGIARADEVGGVCDRAGVIDAETTCAIATLATQQLVEVVEELGLGELNAWQVSLGTHSWFVTRDAKHLWVAEGPLSKNASVMLKKVQECTRGQL
jgi:CheY-like chemotaxis protein